MKKYYKQKVSNEVFKALYKINYPFEKVDVGFSVPHLVDWEPTYEQVLDWFIKQNIPVKFDESFVLECPSTTPGTMTELFNFTKGLDEAIIATINKYEKSNVL